ncbi:MAG: ATP-binding protein, partial [Bacteroidota bacterium]
MRAGLWLLLGSLGLGLPSLWAQPRVTSPYRADFFATEAGLPGNQVNDIEQTADGYLWVATNGGLARFDGHRFITFGPLAPGVPALTSITSLHRSAGDTLFVAIGTGQVFRLDAGHFVLVASAPDGVPFNALAQDRSGRLWGTLNGRLYLQEGEHFRMIDYHVQGGLGSEGMVVSADGQVWGAYARSRGPRAPASTSGRGRCALTTPADPAEQYLLARLTPGAPELAQPTDLRYLIPSQSRREALAGAVTDGTVSLVSPEGAARGRYPLPDNGCPVLLARDATLWVKEGARLLAFRPDAATPVAALDLGFRRYGLPSVFEDREGSLWVGTQTRGLVRVRRDPFQVYVTTEIASNAPIVSISRGDGGSVILIDRVREVFRADSTRPTPVLLNGAPFIAHSAFEVARDQRLVFDRRPPDWPDLPGEVLRQQGTQLQAIATIAQRESDGSIVHEFYADPVDPGVVWLYSSGQVHRIDDVWGPSPRVETVLDSLHQVRHLLRDRRGTVWAGTHRGLYQVTNGEVTRFTQADGLPDDRVRYVHQDAEGVLWLGTYGGGLARLRDGQFQTLTEAEGLAENVVSSILEDPAGHFWMSGNRGVQRVARADLTAVLDGDADRVLAVLYGRESGLLNPETSGVPAFKSPDGRLWFPTFEGAAVVEPEVALQLGREPPLVHVAQVTTPDTTLTHAEGTPIRLAADQRRFAIEYVGLSLRHPERVTYRYRLDGLDADWVQAGAERRAAYTNVPPGTYAFHVEARTHAGVWSETAAALTLRVAPFFYETLWFRLLCGLGVVGLVTGVGYVRLRRARQRERALNVLVRQRTSDLKQRTEDLRRRTEDLEREKHTVAVQADALRDLDRAKSNFFANISHEFRTPLTLIIGPLEDFQDGLHGTVPTPLAQQVEVALSNGQRLLRLVNQLLDVSRLESGTMRLRARPFDARAFVAQTVEAFAPLAERKAIALDQEVSPDVPVGLMLWGDPEQLEKVLGNLLSNALKFTPRGGTVRVRLHTDGGTTANGRAPDGEGAGHLVLTVEDSGSGIAPEHLPYVFERFYQADGSSTRQHPGTGIGLALVKHLVELHHGSVAVTSALGDGATFVVRLPLGQGHLQPHERAPNASVPAMGAPAVGTDPTLTSDALGNERHEGEMLAEETSQKAGLEPPEAHAKTVLVVDDNAEVRAYVRRHLATRYRVLEAADGQQALAHARAFVPDLIVSDVMMPGLDGIGLCRALRTDPDLAFVPLVLLTARAAIQDKLDGLEHGADDYLTKPFNVRELEVRVENLIASRQRLRDHYASAEPPVPAPSLRRYVRDEALTPEHTALLSEVRAAVAAHLADEDFGVDALAKAVGLGRSTLYRRLSSVLDVAPMELIWHLRLERAADLLRTQAGTVSEVAYATGFKNVGHFCTRFKETYGQTPAAYA